MLTLDFAQGYLGGSSEDAEGAEMADDAQPAVQQGGWGRKHSLGESSEII